MLALQFSINYRIHQNIHNVNSNIALYPLSLNSNIYINFSKKRPFVKKKAYSKLYIFI
jgi:hypothetical protein